MITKKFTYIFLSSVLLGCAAPTSEPKPSDEPGLDAGPVVCEPIARRTGTTLDASCSSDTDCDSKICLESGRCVDGASVAYVSERGSSCGSCTLEEPCSTLQRGEESSEVVHVSGILRESVLLTRDVAIYGESGSAIEGQTDVGVLIRAPHVFIRTLRISNIGGNSIQIEQLSDEDRAQFNQVLVGPSGGNGIFVRGHAGAVSCIGCVIEGSIENGIASTFSDVHVYASTVRSNTRGGLLLRGQDNVFKIIGNMIYGNGSTQITYPGVSILDSFRAGAKDFSEITYNTISKNQASSESSAHGISCAVDGGLHVRVGSNIVWGNGRGLGEKPNQMSNMGCEVDNNAVEFGVFESDPAATNTFDVDPVFVDFERGDFHLQPESPLVSAATTSFDTYPYDIDGQLRVRPNSIGADQQTQ